MKTCLLFLFAGLMLAQDEMVTVPKKYVSTEGLTHAKTDSITNNISSWAGVGKEIGIATKEGLNAVVDVSEKFGTTNVGHFVMFMVAYKIIGHQILGIVLGIPLWIVGLCLWMWSFRKFFFGYKTVVKKEGKVKEYEMIPPYKFNSGDAKVAAGIAHLAVICGWSVAFLIIIFGS